MVVKKSFSLGLLSFILLSCVGCDQAVKAIAKGALELRAPVSLLYGMVRFEYVENPGAFLSLGAELPAQARFLFGVVLVGVALLVTLVFLLRSRGLAPAQKLGLALLVGGGSGNLIDRLVNDGAVVDFVSLGIGPLRTGIFNVADVAITAGFLLLCLATWRPAPDPAEADL
ncbi:MAG TPA: signal peptidase II [Thermoanaerobaculia bacterium]|nr:signal peptidase II [Thermoanaerobaculia bacterium]